MEIGHAAVAITRLQDYCPPAYLVDSVALDVDIRDGVTTVTSSLSLRRNPASPDATVMTFNGEGLLLRTLALDDVVLDSDRYHYENGLLTVEGLPEACTLTSVVDIEPEKNTALEGLYQSNGMYCTQCEAEGFRHITFFPDRPDVLARFTTTVRADKARYPLLLSNGNPVATG